MKTVTGDLIDALYTQDKVIDGIEAKLRDAKAKRDGIQARLIKKFTISKLNGARGKLGTAFVRKTDHPSIKNRPKFLKYVVAHKAFDLFQNRITPTAYFERLENGERVPGVKIFTSVRVSVTKAK